ncbi:MAG: hypothetical protein ACOYD4_13685 [Solirubrobacterales bacterium]
MPETPASIAVVLVVESGDADPRPTIDSVLEQECDGLELLVVDASGRGVPDALRGRDRLRLVEAPAADHGELLSRGLEAARAELVCCLTTTDLLRPLALRKLAAALAEVPGAVVAHGWFQRPGEAGEEPATTAPIEFDVAYAIRLHDFPIGPAALARRSALEAVGGLDRALGRAALDDLWIRLAQAAPFTALHEILAERRSPRPPADRVARERIARARVELIDKVYGSDQVPPEIEAVADQAYRNAFVYAATLAADGFNGSEERFYAADRLAPHPPDPATLDRLDARLREREAEVAQLENELAWRSAIVNHLRVGVAERETKIWQLRNPPPEQPEPPPYVRRGRRLVPPPLRPAVRRLAHRVLPWSEQ